MKRKLPSLLGSYSRMLLPRRGLGRDERVPYLAMDSRTLKFDLRHLRAYRQHFGLDPALGVPLLYPQVISLPLHLRLLSRSRMPLSVVGLIHLRSHIQRYRLLDENEPLQFDCRILTSRRSELGLEVDVVTEAWHHDILYWQSITTYLRRGDFLDEGREPDPLPERAQWHTLEAPVHAGVQWRVPKIVGWRYAGLSGDFNPLHLSRLMASHYGFGKPFAHGMWGLARSLTGRRLAENVRLDAHFKAPLPLGSQVKQVYRRLGKKEQWALLSAEGDGQPMLLAQLDEAPDGPLR
ncbi:MaoC family dehydratase [Pseudomonas nicosulfuronedens]|uniref:Protein dehydratase n=1 Tax=Pseudomonas nicosulfuronedens TaxID=2571105 RepID=A0A5R9R9N0_9PSED|nr:MaoC family dehydratase [Pseudomonas nicosulfuronedens]MDH1010171.1 MaoC family dehydratase [Pseudomonas nicosulfuronedens]MDH1980187.1 MaoC family dehydratase [Pseudomonas nicosulfuronedens]MDH2025406.1 MaoC family dehydratase [Pseudomonas nicosulfuronedens]TLX78812.1 protein dehydratase [Pseudomonas nicosulfuronedens]